MDALDALIGGGIGFLTGGPAGAAAGFLSGIAGGGGGNGRNSMNLNRNVDLDYLDVIQRRAALEGYQQGFGEMPQQQGQSGGAQQAGPKRQAGLSQFANQRGGQNSGGSAEGARSAIGQQEAGTMPSVNMGEAYRSYLMQGLMGMNTLPEGQGIAAQQAAGQQTIDAQTQRARENYLQQMSQRGLLRSGMTSTGLADIEQGRAQSLTQLSAQLEAQRQQQLLQTQQFAASALGGQQMRQAELAAQQPTWGETAGGLLGAYAQYEAMRNAPNPYAQMVDPGTALILAGQSINPNAVGLPNVGQSINPNMVTSPAPLSPLLAGGPIGSVGTRPMLSADGRNTMPMPPAQPTTGFAPLARSVPPAMMPGESRPILNADGRNTLYWD